MASPTKPREFLTRFDVGVLLTVIIALIGVAFYVGNIDNKVRSFEERVKDFRGFKRNPFGKRQGY